MTKASMHLEITYDYHPTARHKAEHWMYYDAPGKSLEECKASAEKYFNKQIRGLGWGKITTLTGIGPIRKYTDKARQKTDTHPVDSDPTALAQQKENIERKQPRRTRSKLERLEDSVAKRTEKRARTGPKSEGAAAKPRPKRKAVERPTKPTSKRQPQGKENRGSRKRSA